MELNETQKSVVDILYQTYKSDTVTRTQVNDLVKSKKIKNPSWLKSDDFKVGRGVYKLPIGDNVDEIVEPVDTPKSDTKAAYIVSSLTDNVVPTRDKDFVNFGNFNDVKNIITSKRFYPVFITGLSGNGKTLAVTQACAVVKREMIRVNVTIETDEDDLLGGFRLVNGETKFFSGPVVEAMERGCTLLLDECDLGSNKLLALQPVLEGKGVYLKKVNKWVTPKNGFNVIATANTKGKGSEDGRFIGANIMNEAFLERFAITLEQPYPTAITEKKIVLGAMKKYGEVDEGFATNLVTWGEVIRKTFFDGGVDEVISTRRLDHIVKAFAIFGDKMKSIELCVARFDEDTKESFLDLYTKIDAGVLDENVVTEEADGLTDAEMARGC